MHPPIDRLAPEASALDDEQLLAHYAPPPGPWLRANFITSLDGAATRDGVSGELGDAADRRIFDLLRRQADVILVGAGTARNEEYGAQRLTDEAATWRATHGKAPQPALALISGSLNLDPAAEIFTQAPVRPIIYTIASAPPPARQALSSVADVVTVGNDALDVQALRADLIDRGLHHIHSEGGPRAFGALLQGGAVDEICLTIAPHLEGGDSPRIAHSPDTVAAGMRLAGILRCGDELFLRMIRHS